MAETLAGVSDALAETVASAGKSAVRVDARGRMGASGVVWSTDGAIVTANHVVERDDEIEVGLPNGDTAKASLAGRDPSTDIAVLRTEAAGMAPPKWADDDAARVGNLVLAIGRPGKTVQATLGIVSAIGKGWRTRAGGQVDRYLQTDVVMYPGFSGGGLVDASGLALGMNSSSLLRGVTVSLPVATLRRVVEALLTHGRVRRGFLGVGFQVVRLPATLEQDGDQETGLLVTSVESGSAAEKGGLLLGDSIVGLDGDAVGGPDDLVAKLGADSVGKTMSARILRGGQLEDRDVTIGERE